MLAPEKVPASCEACGKTELLQENLAAWDLYQRFPSMLQVDAGGRVRVDFSAARHVFDLLQIHPDIETFEKLESIARGINQK